VIDQLEQDRKIRPDLFYFFGAIPEQKLKTWLRERNLVIPLDLQEFWQETGGGDLFQSETILGPFGPTETGDDVDSLNDYAEGNDTPADWLVFHTGMCLSAVKLSSGEYFSLEEKSYRVQQTFKSLADWYERLIRKEYAERYGLAFK
jgi:hypothetical protein